MAANRIVPFGALKPLYDRHHTEYEAAALKVLRSGWYILGKETEQFEHEFAAYCKAEHCIGLNSGLDALVLALRALDIQSGDEVIVQANTFIATVLAITANKAVPVFVEPDQYHGIDPHQARQAITPRTKAIIAVHLYGQPCDMKPLCALSSETGIPLIEDCAQAHGATYQNQMIGSFGTISCYSFYPTKNLGAFGDAGAVTTNNKEHAQKIRKLRNYGSEIKYQHDICGTNSRLDEIQAALLRVRLIHMDDIIQERERIASKYLKGIYNKKISLPLVRSDARHVWHQFVIQSTLRDELQSYLSNHGIQTQIHYPIPAHLSQAYQHLGYAPGAFPNTERLAKEILSLPFYNGLPDDDVKYIIDIINKFA